MVIECPSLDTCHREDKGCSFCGLLTSFQLGKIESGETGIEMAVELFDRPRLAITESRKLFGIAEEKFSPAATTPR